MTQPSVPEQKKSDKPVSDESIIKDEAWAAINTPLEVDQLQEFCCDIERLFRINPMLEFKVFKKISDNNYKMQGRNMSQIPSFDFDYTITVEPAAGGCRITYSSGLKTATVVKIEPGDRKNKLVHSKLIITDSYSKVSREEAEKRINEVDKSLTVWLTDIQQYIVRWKRWSKFRFYRWYMRRFWLPMKPTGRRITYMLLWISLVEVALIALGASIYYIEYA